MVKEFETFHQWLLRGIEMTREITFLVRAEAARYLGRCEKPARRLLSATFDPATGPIVTYFIQTVHLMRRMRKVGYEYDADELAAFEKSSGETLETVRRFVIDLAPFLDKETAARLKNAVYTFRVAEEQFFRDFRAGGTLVQMIFCRVMGEGIGILAARHFLTDIAGSLAVRERQLEGIVRTGDCSDRSIETQPQHVLLTGLTQEAREHFTAAMRRAKGRGGKGRQINERQRMDRNEVVTEMRRLKDIAEREKRTLTWLGIVERLKRSPIYAKKLLGVADDSWVSYAKRR